jgi:hypothetical protein
VGGWMLDMKLVLWIAYSNQKLIFFSNCTSLDRENIMKFLFKCKSVRFSTENKTTLCFTGFLMNIHGLLFCFLNISFQPLLGQMPTTALK